MKKLSIILFIIAIERTNQVLCPDGTASSQTGNWYYLLSYSGNAFCQKSSFEQCKNTGMYSAFILRQNYHYTGYTTRYYVMQKKPARYSAYVYDVTSNNRLFVCPYPIGYLWFYKYDPFDGFPPQELLPTDFPETSSTPHKCDSNEKCSPNDFCGHVINRSFDTNYAKCFDKQLCGADSQCSGEECGIFDDEAPYADTMNKFCYKIPGVHDLLSDSAQYIAKSNDIGLKMCNIDANCGQGGKCLLTAGAEWADYDSLNLARRTYQGMCIEPRPYSQTLSFNYLKIHLLDTQSGMREEDFLPVDMKDKRRDQLIGCQKNSDCLELQFCGYAYTFFGSEPSIDKYCYALPEEHKNLLVEPDKIDLVVCNTNKDCGKKRCSIIPNRKYSSIDKTKMAIGLCTTEEVPEKNNNNMIVIIAVAIGLVVAILVALIGGLIILKKKSKKGGKKDKKGKKEKKSKNKTSSSTTTKTMSMAGKSGMGTTI